MKVKKFIAPSMPEAMKMIRNELGQDAVILNSKVVQKGGVFGFFTKKNIEVIAAVDPHPLPKKPTVPKQHYEEINKISKNVEQEVRNKTNNDLLKEIQGLKAMMKEFSDNGNRDSFEHYPGPLRQLHQLLIEQEIDNAIIKDTMGHLLEKWYINKGEATSEEIVSWVKEYYIHKLEQLPFGAINYSKKFINVVGPTGVGKTTTLAKIAAQAVLKYNKKVAFITTDTYRIAAIDQLKTYAKILNIPLEVTYTVDDFKKAKDRFSHFDLVLIDTAGRNFRNKQYVEDLKSVIEYGEDLETILVLALTSKYDDMIEIYQQFSVINIDKLIFTKVDETAKYGSMLNLITKYQTGVAYLTTGQNVPDDIVEASPESITNIVLGVNKNDGSS
ncbi:flagellar biosynthesis protein FlhF [Bacillus sp. Marseille-P3661]|uniref:flagellar biosynthesis protein FlhF n=1 Tax=Bacillus sp. Marseille-P3661 TaxID=1936234 RepID=UPI000C82C914|nr:flagellar biosynthesis protein FlhF [Bacillus sp. Marseille-P3661]